MPVINAPLKCLGYGMFAVGATAVSLDTGSLAAGMNIVGSLASSAVKVTRCEVTPDGAIRYRCDAVAPTATVGSPLPANASYLLDSDPHEFRMIAQAGAVNVHVQFFGEA